MELILETVARATSASPCRVSSLHHEIREDPMERSVVVETFSSQENEVVDRVRHLVREKLDDDVTLFSLEGRCVTLRCVNRHSGR